MASNWLWGDRKEKVVILDSNAILSLFEFSIDLEDELTRLLGCYIIIIPSPIIKELKLLSKTGKSKKNQNAKASLELIKKYKIVVGEGIGDDSIIHLAQKLNGIVVTNDRELRKRVKNASLKTIYLREKGKLVLE